jgi:hypothetical protein
LEIKTGRLNLYGSNSPQLAAKVYCMSESLHS